MMRFARRSYTSPIAGEDSSGKLNFSVPLGHLTTTAPLTTWRVQMTSTAELRAEAEHMRALLRGVSDPAASAAIEEMIDELESRAKEMDNGRATT
jgi:hypothetical protein